MRSALFFILLFLPLSPPLSGKTGNFGEDVRPLLQKYCVECHGADKQKASIRFDIIDPDLVKGNDTEDWHDALDQLNLGEMPPPDEAQPTAEELATLTTWIQGELKNAAIAKRSAGGRVVMRRLTGYEYSNTMSDLLGVDLDYARNLPPEPASPEGFLNNGATLEMAPTQIEAYLEAARRGLEIAIVEGEKPKTFHHAAETSAIGNLPERKVGQHEPIRPEFILDLPEFPREGEFEVTVTVGAFVPDGEGFPRMEVSIGHVPGIIHVPRKLVGEADITATTEAPQTFTFRGRMEDLPQPGPIAFGRSGFKGMIVMIDYFDAEGNHLRYPNRIYAANQPKPKKGQPAPEPWAPQPEKPDGTQLEVMIDAAEFRAPVLASWPPPAHQQLIGELTDEPSEEALYEQLKQFMARAFRRPVLDNEVAQMTDLFYTVRPRSASFEAAMRETLAAILVSPHFLYVVETREGQGAPESISEHELASRLSYFLWSTMPDDALQALADRGQLSHPATLEQQTLRMLHDPRAEAFLERFADQWFDLGALERVAINPEVYPDFDLQLKKDMREETVAFFSEIVRSDSCSLALLNSDWTMLNRRLAKHYGLPTPQGTDFEWVSLPDDAARGGLLGQGAFLMANSNGESAHPIKRAVWILDRLLDTPPAPPPPDTPELDEENEDLAGLSLKDQLAAHRKKEACNNCHRGIDPWGIPMENFNAIGLWTEAHGETPIDATSKLPDGTAIKDMEALKDYLMTERSPWFARSLVNRLSTYALGRSMDLGDEPALETLTEDFVHNGYRISSLIVELTQSELFLTK